MIGARHILLLAWLAAAADGGAGSPAGGTPAAPVARPLIAPIVGGRRVETAGAYRASADQPDLRPVKDGTGDLLYEAGGFSARIATDGSVTFRDKRFSALNLLPWLPLAPPRNVPSLQGTVTGLMREQRVPRVDDTQSNDSRAFLIPLLTPYRPDPREACRACTEPVSLLPMNATGRFDITDEVMRFSGTDPYRYEKAKFLVVTREFRVRKAVQNHADDIRRAHGELSERLQDIACDKRRSVRERKQIIESLRDELDGTTPDAAAAVQKIGRFLEGRFSTRDGGAEPCP